MESLRSAVPKYCFETSLPTSLIYLARDILYVIVLVCFALQIDALPHATLRFTAWAVYGLLQGFVGTGLWVLGHECSHGSFSKYSAINDLVGWALHSVLLDSYFSFKFIHARHHRYHNHITKDPSFVPPTKSEHLTGSGDTILGNLWDATQDTPVVVFLRLLARQAIGWQLYTGLNITAGRESTPYASPTNQMRLIESHYDPTSSLFLPSQRKLIVFSDFGLLLMFGLLYYAHTLLGTAKILLFYAMPYVWVHHWIVASAFLHHTHPLARKYEDKAWSYTKGALSTVDRSFGFIGRHFFHNAVDYHTVHHFFPAIPFHKAEEATKAIRPLLGSYYLHERNASFLESLVQTFLECTYVSEVSEEPWGKGVLVFAKPTTHGQS
ncbi:oleate delta-12 desaturase [Mariannaea sp. PMI_226]|nr:oleate delta-12 desaturase [Mariannaea sp. PMI_226]